MSFDTRIDRSAGGAQIVMKLSGELDAGAGKAARKALTAAYADGAAELTVDLSGLQYLDSQGLGALITALRVVRERGGDIRVVGARSRVRQIFEVTGLARVFGLEPEPVPKATSAA